MKPLLLTMFGMFVAMSMVSSTASADHPMLQELAKLRAAAEEQSRFLNAFLASELGSAGAADDSKQHVEPAKGLSSSGLKPASLQPASGVQSGAKGLVPEEEWRRMFPQKLGARP